MNLGMTSALRPVTRLYSALRGSAYLCYVRQRVWEWLEGVP